MAFAGAFALQWGLGHALDALRAHGHDMVTALQYGFGRLILLQVAGLLPLLLRSRDPDALD